MHGGAGKSGAGRRQADQGGIEMDGTQHGAGNWKNGGRGIITSPIPDNPTRLAMTIHALNDQEVRLLREEIELLMAERQKLLQVTGAAAVLVANLDSDNLPEDQDTIDAAEMLAESLNGLSEETLKDALDVVRAELDPEAQHSAAH
jgi:hypothetical protein